MITLRLLMTDGVLGRLLWTYASDGQVRERVGMADLLADLLRLGMIRWHRRHAKAGQGGFEVEVRFEPAESRLSFVSVRREGGGPESPVRNESALPEAGRLERILWDHSAVGRTVVWVRPGGERLHVGLGADGVYEFAALAALARRHHQTVWRAVAVRAGNAR
jgi:hypothetical protein